MSAEWRERIGVQIMHAMVCTHDGDEFGARAVCQTCFGNTQKIGAIVEREVAAATAESYGRDWDNLSDDERSRILAAARRARPS